MVLGSGDEEDLDEEEAAGVKSEQVESTVSQGKRQRKSELTVGNLWEPLPVAEKPNKWTLFVRGEDASVEDASGLGVEKVVFNLPSDFSPSTVTVSNSPFSITQHGSSSVDVEVVIHMADGSKQEVEHSLNFERPMTSRLVTASNSQQPSTEVVMCSQLLESEGGMFGCVLAANHAENHTLSSRGSAVERPLQAEVAAPVDQAACPSSEVQLNLEIAESAVPHASFKDRCLQDSSDDDAPLGLVLGATGLEVDQVSRKRKLDDPLQPSDQSIAPDPDSDASPNAAAGDNPPN